MLKYALVQVDASILDIQFQFFLDKLISNLYMYKIHLCKKTQTHFTSPFSLQFQSFFGANN